MNISFTATETLYYYDGPLMFQGHDETSRPMFATVVDRDDTNGDDYWVGVKITQETLKGLLENKIPIYDVLTTQRIGSPYFGKNLNRREPTHMTSIVEIPDYWLPTPGTCLNPKSEETESA